MDVTKYVEPTGQYLKADAVKANPSEKFIILREGGMKKSEKFDSERLQIEGEFNKEEKILSCSKTNARFIASKLGPDTKKWVGHQLVLETYRTKTSDSKMVDAINVKEVI